MPILHNQRIHPGVVQIGDTSAAPVIIMQDSIQRDKNPRAVTASKRDQIGDIAQTVTGVMTCAKPGPSVDAPALCKSFAGNCGVTAGLIPEIVRLLAHTVSVSTAAKWRLL